MPQSTGHIRHPEVLPSLYAALAPVYDSLVPMISSDALRVGHSWFDVQNGECVLDLGTGTGRALVPLARANPSGWTEGFDATPGMLSRAQTRLAELPHSRYGLRTGRASALPYPSNCFDAVYSSYLLDVLPPSLLRPVCEEIARVLRPGGRLLLVHLTTPARLLERVWATAVHHIPWLLGGARPIDSRPVLQKSGFQIRARTTTQQLGLRSAVVAAVFEDA